jgi:hypothetical protein
MSEEAPDTGTCPTDPPPAGNCEGECSDREKDDCDAEGGNLIKICETDSETGEQVFRGCSCEDAPVVGVDTMGSSLGW